MGDDVKKDCWGILLRIILFLTCYIVEYLGFDSISSILYISNICDASLTKVNTRSDFSLDPIRI